MMKTLIKFNSKPKLMIYMTNKLLENRRLRKKLKKIVIEIITLTNVIIQPAPIFKPSFLYKALVCSLTF